MSLLSVENLHVSFATEHLHDLSVVRDLSFSVEAGETLALVGESGCGKSVTALAVMRLLDASGRIDSGRITLDGELISAFDEQRMRNVRGRRIGMIFQEPMTSLNPVFTIGAQIAESLQHHLGVDAAGARAQSLRLLEQVHIPAAAERLDQYPHELSGGMKQRVMIAMALSCSPQLLIADEPTTALDVTIQAQILELLDELQQHSAIGVLLITHNLGVVAQHSHRVAVMYAGEIVEQADVHTLFRSPRHPYTRALLESMPAAVSAGARLNVITGTVPLPQHYPPGCRFAPRCSVVLPRCQEERPPRMNDGGVEVGCWLHQPGAHG